MKGAVALDESKRFLDFLRGATAARVFERFGFTLAASLPR
jgi:hypothetical protein